MKIASNINDLIWNSYFSGSAFSLPEHFHFAEFSVITSTSLYFLRFVQSEMSINQLVINSDRQLLYLFSMADIILSSVDKVLCYT